MFEKTFTNFNYPLGKVQKRTKLATFHFYIMLLQYHESLKNTDSLVFKWSQGVKLLNTIVMDPPGSTSMSVVEESRLLQSEAREKADLLQLKSVRRPVKEKSV